MKNNTITEIYFDNFGNELKNVRIIHNISKYLYIVEYQHKQYYAEFNPYINYWYVDIIGKRR